MAAAMADAWGNPSSVHALGRQARDVVERARAHVAGLLGAVPEEIIFTSGGTEADNLAIRGLARAAWVAKGPRCKDQSPHVISSPLEHPAVHGALAALAAEGFAVTLLPVGPAGEIDAADLRAALRDETVLVSLALANHEIGNLYDVAALAALAHQRGALFHCDAVQGVGRVPFDVHVAGVDAATVSAHKLYGPKGTGALFVRRGVSLDPLVAGGHQERERRGGTENVLGIVGFGEACRLATAEAPGGMAGTTELRDRLERQLLDVPGARLHGLLSERVPGTTNLGFEGADGQLVLIGLDLEGVCVSTGAACTSGTLEPSPVMLALGLSPARAREALRFSLGRSTTAAEVDRAAAVTGQVVSRVRAATPVAIRP